MRMPAVLDHLPVRLIAVHRDLHSAAAGGDFRVKRRVAKGREKFLKRIHIIERGGLSDIAAVEQDVDPGRPYTVSLRPFHHRFQMIDVRMDVAVRKQTDKMKNGAVFHTI